MRFYFFLVVFSSLNSHAQISIGNSTTQCTEADLVNGGLIECATLTITASPLFSNTAQAIDVRVRGDVIINDDLILNGSDSPDDATFANYFSGEGGPGADDGGNTNGGNPQSADLPSGGGVGASLVSCAGGGGGGGFAAAALPGSACGSASGGIPGPIFSDIFVNPVRGGFGGGAGGNANATVGGGGGGGGALRIQAGGKIIINASIFANGGRGGDTTTDGGGGGGGSGGLIWLQALGDITNYGVLSADGGAGGSSGNSGAGSAGGRGAVRIESQGMFLNTGSLPPYAEVQAAAPSPASPNLNSSISCGTMASKKPDSSILQFILSFIFAISFFHGKKLRSKFFAKA